MASTKRNGFHWKEWFALNAMASTKMIVFHLKEWFYTTGNGFEQVEFQQKE